MRKETVYMARKIKRQMVQNHQKMKNKIQLLKRLLYGGVPYISVLFLLIFTTIQSMAVDLEDDDLYAKGAVLMDAENQRVLYAKNKDEELAMASTTKIMTCILALEIAKEEDIVIISEYARNMPKVKMNVKKGEQFYLQDLLIAMMLESYNDIAVAIAENIGREYLYPVNPDESVSCVKAFVKEMNEKAKKIGCEHTFFITPNGLDSSESSMNEHGEYVENFHHTTAEDLAKIMSYCVNDSPCREEFLQITGTESMNLYSLENRKYSVVNHNAFLYMDNSAESGKTGFTNKAGYCYVFSAKAGEKHFVASILGCGWPNHKNYKWQDAKKLLTYGVENYDYYRIDEILLPLEPKNFSIQVNGGCTYEKNGRINTDVFSVVSCLDEKGMLIGKNEKIKREIELNKEVIAPVKQGDICGTVRYTVDDFLIREDMLVIGESIYERNIRWSFWTVLRLFFNWGIC